MERKQIANVVIPAAAVAALIALVAVVIVAGGPEETKKKKDAATKVPVSATPSAAGMSETLPSLDDPGWKEVGSGLLIWEVKEGTGDPVPSGAQVTAHYTGWLTDGTVFDSSVKRGSPSPFSLGGVVRGWQLGIPGMKPGGIRRLLIPSDLGYGPGGNPPTIPGGATLVFEVKLISSP